MGKRTPSKPNDDDWRLKAFGGDSYVPGVARSSDLGHQLRAKGQIEAAVAAIKGTRFSSDSRIIDLFSKLGAGARTLGVDGNYLKDGVSVEIDPANLNSEARKLGIGSTRQIAEGLAVSKLDTPEQMKLALDAYTRAAGGSADRRLRFENDTLAGLAQKKFAGTAMSKLAAELTAVKADNPQKLLDIAYEWGQAAKTFGANAAIPADKLPENAVAMGLKTPAHLAQGAILSKLNKAEISPQQTAMFLKAFEAGARGEGKPSLEALTSKTSDDPSALSAMITAPKLKEELARKITAKTTEQESKIKAGLSSFDGIPRLSEETDPTTRPALIKMLGDKAKAYGQAAAIATATKAASPDKPLDEASRIKLQKELAANPAKAQGFSLLKKIETFGNTENLIPAADRKPLESMTGLYEASVFGAIQDKKITPDEAGTLLTTYRKEIGDKTPAMIDGKVNYTTGVLKHFETAAPATFAAGKISFDAPTTGTAPLADDLKRALDTFKALEIVNDGKPNDTKAAEILGVTASQQIQQTGSLSGKISRGLAKEALEIPVAKDGSLDEAAIKQLDAIRTKLANALKGEKVDVKDVKETPDAPNLLAQLKAAKDRVTKGSQPAK